MLPVYEAIEVIRVIPEEVGHTKPWVVLVKTSEGLKSYVVKLYTVNQAENHCVCNEVIGNILGKEFDLLTPSAPHSFIYRMI